jgi:hypothetical protein
VWLHNYNLEGEVRFEFKIAEREWSEFVLTRDEYKANYKSVTLEDGKQSVELRAKVRSTEETDLEISLYCENCIVNNTD